MLPADDFASARPPICCRADIIAGPRTVNTGPTKSNRTKRIFECSCCLKAPQCRRRRAKQTTPSAPPLASPTPKLLMSSYATQTHPGLLSLRSVSVPRQIRPKPRGKCGLPVCKHFAKALRLGKCTRRGGWGGRPVYFTFGARGGRGGRGRGGVGLI